MKYGEKQRHLVWLAVFCMAALMGCASSVVNQSASTTPDMSETQRARGGVASTEAPNMTADSYKSTGDFIRRDKTGTIIGQIRIAVLKTSSAGSLLKWVNRWEKRLIVQGAAMIKMNIERSQPPHAITTDVPLLIVTDYPTGARGAAFVEQLERYVRRGGLIFFRGAEPPPEFVKKGTIRRIGSCHPILSIPYTINGLSNRDLPRVIEIGGRAAGLTFSLSDTPTSRKLGVNLIAYAIAHHPQGQSHLKRSQEQKGRAREKVKMPHIPPAVK